jgi:hypothetical protein
MYIVMTVMSAVFLVIGAAVLRLLKMHQLQAERIRALQNQLSALCSGASGTDNRILQFEKTLTKMKDQQQTLELSGQNGSTRGYDHAIRLARKGAGVKQLIDNCNLSDEEAHLISRLHGDSVKQMNMH